MKIINRFRLRRLQLNHIQANYMKINLAFQTKTKLKIFRLIYNIHQLNKHLHYQESDHIKKAYNKFTLKNNQNL